MTQKCINVWTVGCFLILAPAIVAAADRDPTAAVASLRRDHPRVGVTIQDGLVTRLYGPAFSQGVTARASAEAFLDRHAAVFGVRRDALAGPQAQSIMRGRFTAFHYDQRWNGVEVDATRVTLLVREETGHPLVLVNASTTVVPDDLTPPVLTAQQSHAVAAHANPAMIHLEPAKLVVHPRSTPPVLAWFYWAESAPGSEYERYGYYVDAVTGAVLERRDGVVNVDIIGSVSGFATPGILPDEPDNPPVELPIHGVHLFSTGIEEAYAGPGGDYVLPHEGESEVTVWLDLSGQWCSVQNQADPLNTLTASVDIVPPGPADFLLNADPTELVTAQLNAMIHTTLIHDFVKSVVPGFNGVDQQLLAFVNVNDNCNASYSFGTPGIMRFFTSQPGSEPRCPNTAYAPVIYHEYGHFIIHQALGFTAFGDYHEGVADAIAALLVNDPCMAPGFFGQDQGCLRNVDEPDFVFPVGHPDPHISGLAVAGAFWDMRTELIQRLGDADGLAVARELMYNQILIGPGAIGPGVTIAVLTLDDDDDDIFNGTPNYVAIHQGFTPHGMPGPELSLLEISYPVDPPQTTSPLVETTVSLEIVNGTAGTTLDLGGVTLHYATDGATFAALPLTPVEVLPEGAAYEAPLPPAECFGVVHWYISAGTQTGEIITDPPGAPLDTHVAFVATDVQIAIEDDFEIDRGWLVENIPYDDPFEPGEQDLTIGGWERADPVPVINPNDNDALTQPGAGFGDNGTFAFVTGPLDGESVGTYDVDWGPVILHSPALEVTGGGARFSYARWFYTDDGDDILTVEISNDGGQNWTLVESVDGQTGWVKVEHAVSEFVDPIGEIVFRFTTGDAPNDSITEACVDNFRFVSLFCAIADSDGDADVDLIDFGGLQACFTGENGDGPPQCDVFDFDVDGDVDLIDFGQFLNAAGGG